MFEVKNIGNIFRDKIIILASLICLMHCNNNVIANSIYYRPKHDIKS